MRANKNGKISYVIRKLILGSKRQIICKKFRNDFALKAGDWYYVRSTLKQTKQCFKIMAVSIV